MKIGAVFFLQIRIAALHIDMNVYWYIAFLFMSMFTGMSIWSDNHVSLGFNAELATAIVFYRYWNDRVFLCYSIKLFILVSNFLLNI